MGIKYDSKREQLGEIIKRATTNATYVIPDLQRPYVWSPQQVTRLVDSLFRGWPFGSLLLWEVKPDCFEANEGIPKRPFWRVVDRTGDGTGTQNSALGQPATYQMVLDGQQRVQSLILALGDDQCGLKLLDSEWALDLKDRRVRPSKHWSMASMCIDIEKFKNELGAKHGVVRKIETGKILEWAILDSVSGHSTGRSLDKYVGPLETKKNSPGRFIRLSRFWDLVEKDLSEREYKKLLEPMLKENGVGDAVLRDLLDPLAEFMKVVENVKTNSFVHALQIESFELTPQWDKDAYSDAIVNIFTRLNSAGRILTREEITLAWLKVGWLPELTDNKTAGQSLEELRSGLRDRGLPLETDEIVRLISFVWAVERRSGALIDSKDLLKGEIVRTMAEFVADTWTKLKTRVENFADLVEKRKLPENQGSFNAVIVYLTWYRLAFDRFDAVKGSVSVTERDSLKKQLDQRAVQFLDRWIFGSQWANVWGGGAVRNFQNFATELSTFCDKLKITQAVDLIAAADEGINQMMAKVSVEASDQIKNVVVKDRNRVYSYYSFLWVWHRLETERSENSSIQMRIGSDHVSKPEVDHTVAYKWWEGAVDRQIKAKQDAFIGNDAEKAMIAPDDFDSRKDAIEFINQLGNCSLLEKSFNISKGVRSMRSFMEQVHEFKNGNRQMEAWEAALAFTPTLTCPDDLDLANIKKAIEERGDLIRRDLIDFIDGKKYCVD